MTLKDLLAVASDDFLSIHITSDTSGESVFGEFNTTRNSNWLDFSVKVNRFYPVAITGDDSLNGKYILAVEVERDFIEN